MGHKRLHYDVEKQTKPMCHSQLRQLSDGLVVYCIVHTFLRMFVTLTSVRNAINCNIALFDGCVTANIILYELR